MVSIVFITHLCGYTLKFVNLTHDFEIENVSEIMILVLFNMYIH